MKTGYLGNVNGLGAEPDVPNGTIPYCIIEKQMRDNWLAMLEEMQANGELGKGSLFDWWEDNQFMIEQSITELRTLDIENE